MQPKQPSAGALVTPSVRLTRQLGQGGMGSVWLAEHVGLRTNVVVKFMSADLVTDDQSVERFSREAAAASQVRSPHVVQIFDHGITPEGLPFIVMEWLEGQDLAAHLAHVGRLPAAEVVSIVSQIAKALGKAHARGIVHRDIKPENVFVMREEGEILVKLLDFGIAKTADQMGHTRTGTMIGTPFYMSPEQSLGSKDVDHRSDLWSLGVLGFQLATGARPFVGETIGALTLAIHQGPIPVPSHRAPGLGAAFDSWFLRACARDPAARFQSAKEMADALAVSLAPLALQTAPTVLIPATVEAPAPGVPVRGLSTTAGANASRDVPVASPPRSSTRRFAILGAVGVAIAASAFVLTRRGPPTQPATASSSAQETPSTPPKAVASPSLPAPPTIEPAAIAASSASPPPPSAPKSTPSSKPPSVKKKVVMQPGDDDDKLK